MNQIIFRDKKIFYTVQGTGKPVILVHGFAEDSNIWQHQTEKLKDNFYVIAIDLPGSGQSEILDDNAKIEDYADAVKAIADAESETNGFRSFTILGHSMGGYVTLAFAEKYPSLVEAFGLFHSTAFADDDAKKEARKKGIEFIKNNGTELFLRSTTPNLFSEKTKKENASLLQKLVNDYKNISPKSLIQYYYAMMTRPDRTHALQNATKRVLFISGKNDSVVPLQAFLQQCHLPSISHIYILQNSAHMGMWEEADVSTRRLFEFLANL